jgi:GNAT superfamily N-acetyltransferase
MGHEVDWRAKVGASAAVWSSGGLHLVEEGRWVALSGAKSTHGNAIFCSDDDLETVSRSLADVAALGAKSVIMLGGPALGSAHVLVLAGWGCIGVTPFMHLAAADVDRSVRDTAVRRLGPADVEAARDVVNDAYDDEQAVVGAVAVPDAVMSGGVGQPGPDARSAGLWGIEIDGELASVVLASTVGDASTIWFMCTRRTHRRGGYGRRLISAVLTELVAAGTEHVLLYASEAAHPLYRSMGFGVIEYWQAWSRPRWVLPRA